MHDLLALEKGYVTNSFIIWQLHLNIENKRLIFLATLIISVGKGNQGFPLKTWNHEKCSFIEFLWIPSDIFWTWQISIVFPLHLAAEQAPLNLARTFCVSRYFRLIGSLRKGLFFSYSASFFLPFAQKTGWRQIFQEREENE